MTEKRKRSMSSERRRKISDPSRKRSMSSERQRKISDSSRTKLAIKPLPEKNGTSKNGKVAEIAVKPPEPPVKKVASLTTLYHFADGVDIQLMIIGLIFALVQAVLPPFVWLVMGDFITTAIERETIKFNKTRELEQMAELGIDANSSNIHEFYDQKQAEVDHQFQKSAMPVFIGMFALSVATFIAAFIQRLAWEFSGIRQIFRARKEYIQKLLCMDVAWLESKQSGQVAAMLHEHADSIYQGIADHFPMVIFIFAYLCVTLSVCFYIQWDVTLVMCLALPLLIGTRMIFSKWFVKSMDDELKLQSKMNNLVHETFSCIRTVISFSAQKQTICKYERLTKEHDKMTEERLRASSVYDALAQVLLTELIFTAALCYGMWRVGSEQPGRLAALGINMLYMCVTSISIGFHLTGVSSARQNSHEMQSILNESPKIETDFTKKADFCKKKKPIKHEALNGVDANGKEPPKIRPRCEAGVSFKNVRFSYPSRPEVEVLKGISIDVAAGEHLAIVGSSGSGKSTLTALLLRFYDPTLGSITLGDIDLRSMSPDDIRAQVGLVSQEPVLFDGTISDNIRYGKLDASQGDINDAARRAEAWHYISALPEGMKTRVGDRGLQLSGGQKQRVAIARAVIRNPCVLIFDEATSALDTKHEGEVQKAIDAASKDVTTITIAHRLTTVRNADRIIVLDNGQITEEGSPEELMAKKDGRFYKMYTDQRLDALTQTQPKASMITGKFSMGPADANQILDPVARRRAWARSSLGAGKRIGKSYSVLSQDRKKLAMPVMSKKRSHKSFRNIMEVTLEEEKPYEDEMSLPGKETSFRAFWRLIMNYKEGCMYLCSAIPLTMLRGLFFLLVCFEVASVLEIAMIPAEQMPQRIFIVAAVFTALIIIKTMFEAVGRLFVALYGHGFCSYMRFQMFRQILRHGAAYFDEERNSTGRLVHKMITDTASLNRIVGEKLDLLLPAIVCSTVSISIALWINWHLAIICGFQFPAFFIFRYFELRETIKRQRQMVEEEKKAANLATIVLSNMSTIKAYTLQEHFYDIFCDALRPLKAAMKRQSLISALVFACQFSFTYILIAITLYFGSAMMIQNDITPFDYLRVVLLTQFGANFISQLIASVADLNRARIAAENIMNVIKEPAVDMDNLSDEGLRPKVVGRISLQNVEFRYPSRPIVSILKDLTLQVAPRQSVAIVGPSGSGKSSIIALFQRMYSPTKGQVMVDNYNVRSINPGYLRRVVVSVGQEPTLFSFTIKENIGYGLPEDEATMEKIIEAAKVAHIHDFITSLPQGYDTEVGEFGQHLSGGQKQRIAIARAMVRSPKVLLLDEATAALDSTSEKAVQAALESVSRQCTCIHVSHRLSSIRNVDKIIVLVEGKIAEQGTHQELMEEKGLYYEMNQLEM